MQRQLIEGRPVLVVIDIQGGETHSDGSSGIPLMPGYDACDASLNAMEYLQTGARRTSAEIMAAFGDYSTAAASA